VLASPSRSGFRRPSEIGAINGMVPAIAREQGWQAPFNQTITAIIRAGESRFC